MNNSGEMSIGDLWGELPAPDTAVTPKAILEKQAALLTVKTKGLLQGQVSEGVPSEGKSLCALFATVPTKGYRYKLVHALFNVIHLYPADVYDFVSGEQYQVADEEGFMTFLATALKSEKTREVIASLMRYANDAREDDDIPF